MKHSRIIIFITVLLLTAAFFILDLHQYFSLTSLKANLLQLQNFQHGKPLISISIYMIVYIVVTALSLPGATILSLAGGAVFGLWKGVIIVSFASTIGATLAFLVARFLFRDAIQNRFSKKLEIINSGIEKEGGFYLFSLRLVPLFPFFLINIIMGLTGLPALTFAFVSQIGMFPATIIYVNTGKHLSQLESLQGILSPGLILAFAFLGIFPIAAKKCLDLIRRYKSMAAYEKPKKFDYNLIVIGAGSAGLVASYIAAAVKAKVALIEKHKMGGDCLNTGCVPSKALIKSARVLSQVRRAKDFGFEKGEIQFDFAEVMERVQRIIKKVEPHDSVERYTRLGVECIEGEAFINSPYEVTIKETGSKSGSGLRSGETTLTTRSIIIATGARPAIPKIPGLDKIPFFTSDTIWEIRKQPKRLLVLGGGPIGCELAQAFSSLGSRVTLVQRGNHLMKKEDTEVSELIKGKFESQGITVLTGHAAKEISVKNISIADLPAENVPVEDLPTENIPVKGLPVEEIPAENISLQNSVSRKSNPVYHLICTHNGQDKIIEFDTLLLALGRRPNVTGLGLEKLGINISDKGTIESGDFLETSIPNIFCAGDVAGPYQFTHTAAHQSWFASVNALFGGIKKFRVDYRAVPWATFTDPEVARVGLNESEAAAKGILYEVTRFGIDDLDRAIADSEDHGFVKVLTVPGKDKILGVTIVGSHAGDIISEFVLAMKHGLGLNKILGTIHIYPTMAEANKYAAGQWKRAHAPEKILVWLEKFHIWMRNGKK